LVVDDQAVDLAVLTTMNVQVRTEISADGLSNEQYPWRDLVSHLLECRPIVPRLVEVVVDRRPLVAVADGSQLLFRWFVSDVYQTDLGAVVRPVAQVNVLVQRL